MTALELGERVPMSIKQARENLRFDFALLQLFIPLLIAGVIFAIGINRRHEQDVLPIGRPDPPIGTGRDVGHRMGLTDERARARIEVTYPNLRRITRFRSPDQPFAVG
jgi:hypothetical protein